MEKEKNSSSFKLKQQIKYEIDQLSDQLIIMKGNSIQQKASFAMLLQELKRYNIHLKEISKCK